MSDIRFLPDLAADDDDVGEFFLPTAEPDALQPEDEREQYDVQILAGLVSP